MPAVSVEDQGRADGRADGRVTDIVIVGGGTAGWMTAAALSKVLSPEHRIRLVESDEIGTVGVGEATIPMIKLFNQALDLDENAFIRETKGSFKLGIEFVNWGRIGDSYIHGFGKIGQDLGLLPFYQYWLKMHQAGKAGPLDEYSINTLACRHDKFMPARSDRPNSPLADIAYAYHFDAGLYARYLRRQAEARGVLRIEGKVSHVEQRAEDGFVDAVVLESGERVAGQLFVDCSGFRGLLIEQTLKTGYIDWTHWLPCDRAVAVQCESKATLTPYTRSTAREAGWQWRIPLQHRVGNGIVFSSRHMDDDTAKQTLLDTIEGRPLIEPRVIRFKPGQRREVWRANCIAIGLSSGFIEPLESTNIHLIQRGVIRLLQMFPTVITQPDIDEYNRQAEQEITSIRDFVVMHYKVTDREDTPYWRACRDMVVPSTLARRIELFRETGRVFREGNELFAENSWIQVMMGQGILPKHYHPAADLMSDAELHDFLERIRVPIEQTVSRLPAHGDYLRDYCAEPMATAG